MASFAHIPEFFGRATAVLGEHAALHETVGRLRQRCTVDPDAEGLPALHELLGEFVAQLASHFAAEEGEGYFGTLLDAFPVSSETVAKLRAEHAVFLELARNLSAWAEEPSRPAELAVTLSALLDDLGRHERAESLLLQRYFSEGQP